MFDSTRILSIILSIPGILIAFTFHEYAHAFVADKLGDKTPKFQGRLTLNPIAHIDPIGFILILILGFGWAKPVQTNPAAYKHYYKDDLKVSVAGPLANLAVGFVFAFITIILSRVLTGNSPITVIIIMIASITSRLNCMLFLLNLLPIPGFDGFHILRDLFPRAFYNVADSMYRYQLIIFMVLVFPIIGGHSVFDYIIGVPSNAIYSMFEGLALKVVGF
ncbi:MAG: site-2 protease family protein [Clostridium sp.]|uniref:site-2 protease family protein n=1 Tax=Clostridium sp. TaxID=1506 RepID=UPI0039EBDF2B